MGRTEGNGRSQGKYAGLGCALMTNTTRYYTAGWDGTGYVQIIDGKEVSDNVRFTDFLCDRLPRLISQIPVSEIFPALRMSITSDIRLHIDFGVVELEEPKASNIINEYANDGVYSTRGANGFGASTPTMA